MHHTDMDMVFFIIRLLLHIYRRRASFSLSSSQCLLEL